MGSQKITYILILCIVGCKSKKYDNFTLFMGIPNTEEELEFYKTLMVEYNVLYWKKPGMLYSYVEFSIGPNQLETLFLDAYRKKVSLNVITRDIQSAFDKQTINHYTKWHLDTFDWTGYYRVEDIYNWFEDLEKSNPDIIKVIKIGSTVEQRLIMAVKIKFQQFQPRPKVIIEGGIHGREWISPAFVTYMMNVLVNAPSSKNKILQDMALAYEWIFVPVLNPDGYEYTHTEVSGDLMTKLKDGRQPIATAISAEVYVDTQDWFKNQRDRLWGKNRRHIHGVDLNKNFDAVFGTVGVSHHRFGDSYCGEVEFSEPESKAMADLVTSNRRDLKYYIAFHSFGQNFIIPYSFSDQYMDNYEKVKAMGEKVVEEIRRRHETEYSVGTTHELKGYTVSGTSTSWAKKIFKIPYVATFELRDTGMNGFALPSEEILPTCLETMDGVCAFLGYRGCVLGNPEDNSSKVKPSAIVKFAKGHCVLPKVFLILMCSLLSI